jgi:hypothetical protein
MKPAGCVFDRPAFDNMANGICGHVMKYPNTKCYVVAFLIVITPKSKYSFFAAIIL